MVPQRRTAPRHGTVLYHMDGVVLHYIYGMGLCRRDARYCTTWTAWRRVVYDSDGTVLYHMDGMV